MTRTLVVEKCIARNDVLGRTRIAWNDSGMITEVARTNADADEHLALPGLIDTHFHGFGGVDTAFAVPPPEAWSRLDAGLLARGITGYVAGTCSGDPKAIAKIAQNIRVAQPMGLLGLFLEGAFASPDALGGLPAEQVREADRALCADLLAAGQGLVRTVLVSPEIDGACDLIGFLREQNVIAAIGHSRADYAQATRSIDAGATRAVHWPNVMRWGDHHDPAIAVAVLNDDRVFVEVIGDNQHVAWPMVKLAASCKGDRLVTISDSVAVAGAVDDARIMDACGLEMRDGRLYKAGTNVHSGSHRPLDECLGLQTSLGVLDPAYVTSTCSAHAAESLGLCDRGEIAIGKRADLAVADESGALVQVYRGGQPAFEG